MAAGEGSGPDGRHYGGIIQNTSPFQLLSSSIKSSTPTTQYNSTHPGAASTWFSRTEADNASKSNTTWMSTPKTFSVETGKDQGNYTTNNINDNFTDLRLPTTTPTNFYIAESANFTSSTNTTTWTTSNVKFSQDSDFDPCYYLQSWSFSYRVSALYGICAIGVLGNLLAFAVLSRSTKWKKPSGIYLSTLAIAESIYLILEVCGRAGVADISDAACAGLHYPRYVAKGVSSILVVLIGIERCMKVTHPLQFAARSGHSVRNAWIQVAVAVIFSTLANAFMPFTGKQIRTTFKCLCYFDLPIKI